LVTGGPRHFRSLYELACFDFFCSDNSVRHQLPARTVTSAVVLVGGSAKISVTEEVLLVSDDIQRRWKSFSHSCTLEKVRMMIKFGKFKKIRLSGFLF
jgi:hypothetical protein